MYRIVAIEDDPSMRRLLQMTLAPEGYECLTAANAALGIAACLQEKPDLILLDVNLPDGNGIEVCRRIKAEASLRHIPIMLLTGEASAVDLRIEGLRSGAEDYIIKPFNHKELVSRIKRVIKTGARPTHS